MKPWTLRSPFKFTVLILTLTLGLSQFAESRKRHRQSKVIEDLITEPLQEALVSPPQDLEVCFSPEEPCDVKLIKFFRQAKTSLDIAIFDLTMDQAAHQILEASKKIRVRIVADRRQAHEQHSLIPLLIKAGVPLRYGHQRGIMHNKFTIVDGKMLETGSFNYTHHARKHNNENQIYIYNPVVVKKYTNRFEKLWSESDQPKLEN